MATIKLVVLFPLFIEISLAFKDSEYDGYDDDPRARGGFRPNTVFKDGEEMYGDIKVEDISDVDYEDYSEDKYDGPYMLGMSPEDELRYKYSMAMEGRGWIDKILGAVSTVQNFFTGTDFEKEARGTRYYLRKKNENSYHHLRRSGSDATRYWYQDGDVVLLIHGFSCCNDKTRAERLKDAETMQYGHKFAALGRNYNIIVVDWIHLSARSALQYYQAAYATVYVGRDVGDFLIRLKDRGLISDWSKVHIIGSSLGAHVSGAAGHRVKEKGGGLLGRITGVDPAGPLYQDNGQLPSDHEKALDKEDAAFVDVRENKLMSGMLTVSKSGRFGTSVQSGHVDFYVNGGETQPKCSLKKDITGCSHLRCFGFFMKSLYQSISACPCSSWKLYKAGYCKKDCIDFGLSCPRSASGKYYLALP